MSDGGVIEFSAKFNEQSAKKIIQSAEEITKHKYDIIFNPTIDKNGNITYETLAKNFKKMVSELQNIANKSLKNLPNTLNNLNTTQSVLEINNLITVLKQLQMVESFDYVKFEDDLSNATKLVHLPKIKIDGINTSNLDLMIKSLETITNRFNLNNNELIQVASKDSTAVQKALRIYSETIASESKDDSAKINKSNEELNNQLIALQLILNKADLFKNSGNTQKISTFKTFLTKELKDVEGSKEIIDTFFKKISSQYDTSYKKFIDNLKKKQIDLIGELQNRGLQLNSNNLLTTVKTFNSNLENNVSNGTLNGDMKYNLQFDSSQLKEVLSIIEEIKTKVLELEKNKILINTDFETCEKLKNTLNEITSQIQNINNLGKIKLQLDSNTLSSFNKEILTIEEKLTNLTKGLISNSTNPIINSNNDTSKIINQINVSSNNSNNISRINSEINALENKIKEFNKNQTLIINVDSNQVQNAIDKLNVLSLNIGNKENNNGKITSSTNIGISNVNQQLQNINKITNIFDQNSINNNIESLIKNINSKLSQTNKIILDFDSTNIDTKINGIKEKLNNLSANINKITMSGVAKENLKNIPISFKPITPNNTDKTKLLLDLESSINQGNGIKVKVGNLDAVSTGAINNLISTIENKLKGINLNIPIKANQEILTNTNLNANSENNNSNNKQINNINSLVNKYELLKEKISSCSFELSKFSNEQIKPVASNEILKLQELIQTCDNNLNTLKSDISNLNPSVISKLSNTTSLDADIKKYTDIILKLKQLDKIQKSIQNGTLNLKNNKFNILNTNGLLNTVDDIQNKLKEIDYSNLEKAEKELLKIKNDYEEINNKVNALNSNDKHINVAKQTQKSIQQTIKSLNDYHKNPQISSIQGYDKILVNDDENINKNITLIENLNNVREKLTKSVQEYQNLIKDSNQSNEDIQKIKNTKVEIDNLSNAYERLKKLSSLILTNTKTQTSQVKISNGFAKLQTDISKYIDKNGKLLSDYNLKSQFYTLQSDIGNSKDMTKQSLVGFQTRFEELQNQVTKLGKTGRSVAQELDHVFSKLGIKAMIGMMSYRIISYFKEMVNTVKEADTAMVNLKRVTNETNEQYSQFFKTSTQNAKELATTITDVVNSVASFSRLGYSLNEATTLGNVATMYSNVGYIDIDTASSDIVSAMKAFNINAEDAISIVDAFNDVGNKFALTSANIGEGLSQSASALAVANNSLNESIAMIAGGTEITQDANSMGNALKTLSMRIRGSKAELEEIGEDTDGLADSTSKMRDEIKALSGVDIMVDSQTYKSTFQIMREIANVWNDLSDINQAGLLEKLAGKNRANQVSALLSNWSQVEKALEVANNAEGSAERENEKYVDSIEGKINVIKASAQELSTTSIDNEFIKDTLDGVNKLINGINDLADGIGGLPTLISAVATAYGLMNKKFGSLGSTREWLDSQLKDMTNSFTGKVEFKVPIELDQNSMISNSKTIMTEFDKFNASLNNNTISEYFKNAEKDIIQSNNYLKMYLQNCQKLNKQANFQDYTNYLRNNGLGINGKNDLDEIIKQYNALATTEKTNGKNIKVLSQAQKDFLTTLSLSNPKIADTITKMNTATVTTSGYNLQLALTTAKTIALTLASTTLNAVVGGLISTMAMYLVSAIINGIKNIGKLSEKTKELTQNLQTQSDEIKEYISTLKELKSAKEKAFENYDKESLIETNSNLLELQKEIINTYGESAKGIDLVNGKLEEQLKIVQNIQTESDKDFLSGIDTQKSLKTAQNTLFNDNYKFSIAKSYYTQLKNELNEILKKNNGELSKTSNRNYYLSFDFDSTKINDARTQIQSLYNDIESINEKNDYKYTPLLYKLQTQIDKFDNDKINELEEFYNQWLNSVINTSEQTFGTDNKSIKQYKLEVADITKQLDDAITNNDNDLALGLREKLQSLETELLSFNLGETLIDSVSGQKATGVETIIKSWFTGYLDDYEKELQNLKVEEIIKNSNLEQTIQKLFSGKSNLDVTLELQNIDFNDLSNFTVEYSKGLSQLKSIMDITGLSIEDLVQHLMDLGLIEQDVSQYQPNIANNIDKISDLTNDLNTELGNDNDGASTLSEQIEIIKSAFEDLASTGKITSENLLALTKSGLSNVLKYDSQAKNYAIDREELEKLIKTKYDKLKADALESKQALENAKNQDLQNIANEKDAKTKAIMQVKFNEVGYDDKINEINNDLYIIEQNYKETMQELNPSKIGLTTITNFRNELENVSNAFQKLRKGSSLENEDISNLIDSGFGNALEINEENNLVTINIEKYHELAQAKIEAYKVSTQNTITSLNNEKQKLTNLINEYQKTISSTTSSTSDKSYASQQISELTPKLNECTTSLKENQIVLEMWNEVMAEIPSTISGSFGDILATTKNLESSASTMSSAFKEVKDNGYLSVNTATNLIDSGYASCVVLDKQTNKLTLNASAYKELAESEINAQLAELQLIVAKGQATEQIYAQIQALQLLKNNLAMVTSGSYGDNTDYWKAEAEEQFAYLEHLHNMNVIDDAHYYKYLNELNKEYYANRIEYLDDYRKYEEEIYKGQIEAQKSLLEAQKDAFEEQKDYWNDQKDLIQDQIDSIEDTKDYWNDQKELIEDQKDAIQDQIDALQDKNEEEDRAIKLKEAQIRLQNALNQKTIRVFSEELGWQWESDKNEIKEAQQELDDLLREEEIAQLEKQIDALDEQIDSIDDIIDDLDDQIDVLKDQQDAIDKEIKAIEKQENLLDKQIEQLENELNALNSNHIDEFSGLTNAVNEFKKLSQENINALLGLPSDFNTSAKTSIQEPINNLKNSVDLTNSTLDELKQQANNSNGLFKSSSQVAQTLTINIDRIVTENPYDFVGQLTNILKQQL